MSYELIQSYPKTQGCPSLPVGTIIYPITVENQSHFIGFDSRNLFWTVDFVQANPKIFKAI
jgi:hypothetical protein